MIRVEIWGEIQVVKTRVHIEEITSFSRVGLISTEDVVDCFVDALCANMSDTTLLDNLG